jgi:gliding motility-associated protein GldM
MLSTQRTSSTLILLACSTLFVLFFSACADKIRTNIIDFKALDEGLINSNIAINNSNQTVLASLENKMTDPVTAEKARIWYPKAQLIQKLSNEVYDYIAGLRSDLKKEAGLKNDDAVESYRESDKNAVIHLFDKQEKGKELFEQLKTYKKNILAIDPELEKEFNNTMLLTTSAFDAEKEKQDFTKTFFDDIPTMAALAMLSKFQNNIRIVENKMINFCDNKCSYNAFVIHTYSAMITKSSSYVKAGEEIEIIAGIGAFSKAAQPIILINGMNVSTDADGAAHYKFKSSDKPGQHSVPVVISFNDQEGKKQTITKNIEYTVADTKQ